MTEHAVAKVLLDSPLPQLDRLFDYAIPRELDDQAQPGVRVRVPLRSAGRMVDGYLIERVLQEPGERPLSELDAVISPVPVVPRQLYTLARRVADRAAGSASDILRLAVPKRMVRAEKAWAAAGSPEMPRVDDTAWADAALSAFPELAERVDREDRLAVLAPPHLIPAPQAVSESQDAPWIGAWAELLVAAAVRTLSQGRSAIIVVPDHRDQSHIEAALAGRVPDTAVVRHDARQSSPDRYAGYLRTLDPVPCIVVGQRSAVYAPVHRLGLIAMWDDGDPLLDEPLSPGVHARDAALVRQELDSCALIFAGHTRTTDVERLVGIGWVHDVAPRRRTAPRVVLSATREGESRGARVPSAAFAAAREALASGPVLVQVARPGYAPVLVCAECRRPARCAHCAGPLRAARAGATPECAWCGRAATSWTCPHCSSTRVRMASAGSERTADELGRAFPGIRVIVADGDHPVARIDARPALVVATRGAEPIPDGGYRAIILLDGERMLLADDLRIGESALRWWMNAAALAAAGAPVHLVGVAGPVARALATWTPAAYARSELADRTPLRMPPVVRVAALEGAPARVEAALSSLRADVPAFPAGDVLGPVLHDDGTARALVRFDYGNGAKIAESLRSSVVADALRARRARKGSGPQPRNTLRVRVDVPDLDL
jgi:primosomal protein N' (replication factor Y)